MLIAIGIIIVIFFCILLLFTTPSLSPVPYFPTNQKDLPLILDSLKIDNNQVIFDLGAGDGIVLLEAAKKAYKEQKNTRFVAVEINPMLVFIITLRTLYHPNRKNIKVVWGDMFKLDYDRLMTRWYYSAVFYLYISPWLLEKTLRQIMQSSPKKRIVSYMYAIKPLADIEKSERGIHKVFVYELPGNNHDPNSVTT